MFRAEGESSRNNDAKRVYFGITHNGKEYGNVLMSEQVGYKVQMFYPIVEMGVQDDANIADIEPGDELCLVCTRELDRVLASFSTQTVVIEVTEQRVKVTNEVGSVMVVRSAASRQLELPLCETACKRVATTLAHGVDAEQLGSDALRVPVMALAGALLPARNLVTMAGNRPDQKGVYLSVKSDGSRTSLRVTGVHEKGVFVYENDKEAVSSGNLKEEIACVISPDAAKRLRELLCAEIASGSDEKGVCHKEVYMKMFGYEHLDVCCGNWMMHIDAIEICDIDCEGYLNMEGKYMFEVKRSALLQVCNGLLLTDETEAYVTFDKDKILFEGEDSEHRGERVLAVECTRYGITDDLPLRKYAIRPMAMMLSAAGAAENSKTVRIISDGEDVIGLECEAYKVFVG